MYPCQERSGMEVRGEYGAAAEVRSTPRTGLQARNRATATMGPAGRLAYVRRRYIFWCKRNGYAGRVCGRAGTGGQEGRSGSGNVVILYASMNALLIRNIALKKTFRKTLLACQKSSPSVSLLSQYRGPPVTRQSSSRKVQDETGVVRRQVRYGCWELGAGSRAWMNVLCAPVSQAH